MSTIHEILRREIGGLMEITDGQLERFERYYALLLEWNAKVNLTAITGPVDVAQKHFADSLLPLCYGLIPPGARAVDIGAGAGFPGIPLAIMKSDIKLTLLDSQIKRVRFLKEVCAALEIDADVIHERAETAAHRKEHREGYDIALARAVAPLNSLMELTIPFAKTGGVVIAYKGPMAQAELGHCAAAMQTLGVRAKVIDIEAAWGERCLVVIEKHRVTPSRYPRKPGEPARNPL